MTTTIATVDLAAEGEHEHRVVRPSHPVRRTHTRGGLAALGFAVTIALVGAVVMATIDAWPDASVGEVIALVNVWLGVLLGPARWCARAVRASVDVARARAASGGAVPQPPVEPPVENPIEGTPMNRDLRGARIFGVSLLLAAIGFLAAGHFVPMIMSGGAGMLTLLVTIVVPPRSPRHAPATLTVTPHPLTLGGPLRAKWQAPVSLRGAKVLDVTLGCYDDLYDVDVREDSTVPDIKVELLYGREPRRGTTVSFEARRRQLWATRADLVKKQVLVDRTLELTAQVPAESADKPLPPTSLLSGTPSYWELMVEAVVNGRYHRWIHLLPVYLSNDARTKPEPSVAIEGTREPTVPFLVSACEHELDDAGLCAKCGGHLVPTSEVEEFARRRLRMEVAELRELAAHYPGGRVPCPSCGARMNELPLKGVTVDLCSKCGSLWTDEGELAKLADA